MKKKIQSIFPEDDLNDQLRPEYHIDYRKAKPNRFAGRVKLPGNGVRSGKKLKHTPDPVERHTITIYKSQAQFLRGIDKNLSSAIRKLIARAQ